MNTTLNIGLAGLGTVGGGLVRLLSENSEEIRARSGCDFNLKAVAVRNPNRKRDLPEGVRLTTDPMTLADDPDIDVVIELMGGIDTAKELITRSLAKGKQVVTANKALLLSLIHIEMCIRDRSRSAGQRQHGPEAPRGNITAQLVHQRDVVTDDDRIRPVLVARCV